MEAKRPVLLLFGKTSIMPLVDLLASDYDLYVIYPQLAQGARVRDLSVFDLGELGTIEAHNQSVNVVAQLMGPIVQGLLDKSIDRRILGVVGEPGVLERPALAEWLPGVVAKILLTQIRLTMALERLRTERDVRVLVIENDVEWNMTCAVQWARQHGIPSLHVPHAVYHDMWRARRDIHDQARSDWLAVAGPFQRDWYIRRGVDESKMRMTGLPQWDKWANRKRNTARARQLLGLNDMPTICCAASWQQETSLLGFAKQVGFTNDDFIEVVLRTLSNVAQIIIKLHPNSPENQAAYYAQFCQKLGITCLMTDSHLAECFDASDMVLSFGPSSILVEAAMAGVPRLAAFDGYHEDDAVATFTALDPSALLVAIKQAVQGEHNTFLARYAGQADGRAAERITEWIKELAA